MPTHTHTPLGTYPQSESETEYSLTNISYPPERQKFHPLPHPINQVGSRIMTLQMAPTAERCDFPTWFKGPKHWHALMGNTGYIFHPR